MRSKDRGEPSNLPTDDLEHHGSQESQYFDRLSPHSPCDYKGLQKWFKTQIVWLKQKVKGGRLFPGEIWTYRTVQRKIKTISGCTVSEQLECSWEGIQSRISEWVKLEDYPQDKECK